ncbi:MAG: hypothetical protein FWG90_11955 [Oscillospiraceae bacterium]|nr:hypothetical protein [Oscillospiraceae bacterium]
MAERKRKRDTLLEYIRTAAPIAAALVIFLVSASFILHRINSARIYNERWKDYEDCGI